MNIVNFVSQKTVAPRLLTSVLTIAVLAVSSCISNAQTPAAQPAAAPAESQPADVAALGTTEKAAWEKTQQELEDKNSQLSKQLTAVVTQDAAFNKMLAEFNATVADQNALRQKLSEKTKADPTYIEATARVAELEKAFRTNPTDEAAKKAFETERDKTNQLATALGSEFQGNISANDQLINGSRKGMLARLSSIEVDEMTAALLAEIKSLRAQEPKEFQAYLTAAGLVTPAQWLSRQPKPVFKPGHTMPALTRYGWDLSYETHKVLAEDWHYALQTNYLTDEVVARFDDPTTREAKMGALTLLDPKKYPLAVVLSRDEPANPAPETFLRDAEGKLIAGKIFSPLNPQSTLDQMAELRARPLRELRKKVPINMILNGGEYGLGVPGFMRDHATKDPTVAAAQAESGLDWISFISRAKKREVDTIADAVREAVPDRSLYIYYSTGPADRNRYGGWRDWGMDPEDSLKGSDLPATEYYYKHFNSGYLPDGQGNDILTRALNSVGFQIAHNKKNYYDWVTSGFVGGAIEDARWNSAPAAATTAATSTKKSEERKLSNGNVAALVDPNASELSPMNLYTGFLKCLFTTGTLGANAGYYALPTGGFNASFSADKPRQWVQQMARLSHVQALFSYLEDDLREGDLLKGDGQHRWTRDQPSYEFSSSEPNVRIVARKTTINEKSRWLVTAWAADGLTRPTKTTIPELGQLTLLARPEGSVYRVTLQNGKPQLEWLDPDGMTPTAKGFAPEEVTTEQINTQWKAPDQPALENLQLHFDAAQGVEKDDANAVISWKPEGALADWAVTSSTENKLPAYANRRPPLWVADAVNGLPALRFSGTGASLMSGKLKPEAGLKEATMTIFAVFASSVPQETMPQNGSNNSIFRVPSGSGINNGPWPDATKKTWQMRMATAASKDSPEYIVVGAPFWGAEHIASDFFFSGDIAEILVYNGEISSAQQAQTRLYLKQKYRL